MFYLVIFLILLVFSILEISNQKRINHKILIGLSWGILVLVAGLRYETGTDWPMYQGILDKVLPISKLFTAEGLKLISLRETGFIVLSSLFKQFGLGLQALFFFVTLFNVTLITRSLSHYTKYIVTGLFVYYSVVYLKMEFAMIRQAMAASICFFSFRYIQERKMWKYFILIFTAFLFHRSALIMFPLYFFLNIRFSNKILLVVLFLGCAVMFFHIPWFSQSLLFITKFMGNTYYEKAVVYTSDEIFGANRLLSVEFLLNIFLVFLFLFYRKYLDMKKYGNLFLNLFMMGIVTYYYFYESITMSYRFRLYFLYSLIILFPYLIEVIRDYARLKKIAFIAVLLIYCSAYNGKIYLHIPPPSLLYNPYQNYIEYKILKKESLGKERIYNHLEKMREDAKNTRDKK